MKYIRDKKGNIISKSVNLRGIREYVGKHIVKVASIDMISNGEGKLCIIFDNQASFECNFASFEVLKDFVARWRNIKGCKLLVNGVDTIA